MEISRRAGQARLRLVTGSSEHNSRCKESINSAASPIGLLVRSRSMSLTAPGDNPTRVPISESVSPAFFRKSLMRDAQVVISPSLRQAVDLSQRLPVTAVRDNLGMPRPPDLPRFSSIGPRIRYWRERRKIPRKDFAKLIGMSYSGLADLENDRSKAGTKLHMIAAKLRLNAHYLEHDKGEPESEYAQEPPPEPQPWPFASVPKSHIDRLNPIERKYAEVRLQEALAEIDAQRRQSRKAS